MDKEITLDEAKERLQAAQQENLVACQNGLIELLKKHDCKLTCKLSIVEGKIIGDVVLSQNNPIA